MARKLIYGFETGSLSSEPFLLNGIIATYASIVGSVSLESTIVRSGGGSLKLTPASGAAGYWDAQASVTFSRPYHIRFYCRITSLPALQRMLFGEITTNQINIMINPSGTLQVYSYITSLITSSVALTDTAKWYRVELKSVSSPSSLTELLIDGVSQGTSVTSGGTDMLFGATDTVAATYTAYIDDVVMDDAAYPGDGKVVLLVPISDNAIAAKWTGGAGGTSNLFDAVNNNPPIGTATETNLTQIEHAGGAAGTTDAYDANMTSYETAGIVVGDTVNAVFPFIWHGEDIATGDKLLSFNIHSNPATSNTGSFNAANTSGALGTWPAGWWTTTGPIGSSPSVTLGTSPVMRVIRPETASRVASVCFMGIYVDYTPAPAGGAVVLPVFINQYRQRRN